MKNNSETKLVNLFDICNPKQWKTISTKDLTETGFPLYGANGKIGFYSEYNHEEPTLLITCRGATCGSLIISEPKSYINGNAMSLDNLRNDIDIRYLFYYLFQRGFKDSISGSAQPQITRQGLQKIQIRLLPLQAQKQIVKILDQADALRQKRKQAIELLDEYLKSVFLEMFGDPVRNPKGWDVKELLELVSGDCPLTYGIVQPGDEYANGVYIVRPVDLIADYIGIKGLKKISPTIDKKFKRTKLKGGELLLSVRGTTGVISIASPELRDANVTRGITPIWFPESFINLFMFYQLRSNSIQKNIKEKTYGSALQQINLKDVRELKVINPPIELQKKFSNIAQKYEFLKQTMNAQSIEMDNQFQSLMQRAFEGEL